MIKKLFALLLSGAVAFSSVTNFITAFAEETKLWEKFLRYDLCITDYDALTPEEQELCHFIFDTEQGTEEAIRCERARRTLAHDPNLGERVTVEQAENSYGIGDWYGGTMLDSHRLVHCVPDIRHLDSWYDGHYSCCDYWLDDTGTDFIRVYGGEFGEFGGMEHVTIYEIYNGHYITEQESIYCKPLPQYKSTKTGTTEMDISDFPDFVFEDGNYYLLQPDGTAILKMSQYAQYYGQRYVPGVVSEPVIIPDSVQGHTVVAIDNSAFYSAPVSEIQLPETVEYICNLAFAYCHHLKKINFPKNIKTTGFYAFFETALEEVCLNNPEPITTHGNIFLVQTHF